ncbi:MAG: hypothetical protein DSY87_02315 [Methylococcus sp.]|nr:MAG: hypothetical protein DSY87_02315 [Methylococcus sp.]
MRWLTVWLASFGIRSWTGIDSGKRTETPLNVFGPEQSHYMQSKECQAGERNLVVENLMESGRLFNIEREELVDLFQGSVDRYCIYAARSKKGT